MGFAKRIVVCPECHNRGRSPMCCCSPSRSTVAPRAEEQLVADHPKPHALGEAGRQYMLTTGDPVRHGHCIVGFIMARTSRWAQEPWAGQGEGDASPPPSRCGRYRCKEQLVEAVVEAIRLLSKNIYFVAFARATHLYSTPP